MVSLQESVDGREGYVKLEFLQDLCLHLHNLLLRVCIVSDVDKVTYSGNMYLLVLASDQEGSDSNQLVLTPFDILIVTVTV